MFNSLKKKFNTALQEASIITENFQQHYRQRVSPDISLSGSRNSLTSNSDLGLPFDVNVAAGSNLLAKYEDDWKSIHINNVENSEKAHTVAQQLQEIEIHMTNQHIAITDLLHCLASIPVLIEKLKTCRKILDDVHKLSHIVNQELDKLEDLSEECDLQEYILEKQCEISKYKQRKMENLETYRQKVAKEHQQRIEDHEKNLRKIQRERQAVFDDAFRHDLEEFKQRGHIPKIHTSFNQDVNLEEVVLDNSENKDALEEFLKE